MADEYDFTDKSEQEVLLSFTANKGHRTRNANKINNLLTLQDQKYSKITEATLLNIVSALERYQDRLNIFAAWLDLHELASADSRSGYPGNSHGDSSKQSDARHPQLRTAGRSRCSRRSRPSSSTTTSTWANSQTCNGPEARQAELRL